MAGSSSYTIKHSYLDSQINPMKALEISFVADAADGSFPVFNLPTGFGGVCMDTAVVFGSPAPDALTFTIKDFTGIDVDTATAITASTSRGRISNTPMASGGSVTLTENTTNSAQVKVVLYMV